MVGRAGRQLEQIGQGHWWRTAFTDAERERVEAANASFMASVRFSSTGGEEDDTEGAAGDERERVGGSGPEDRGPSSAGGVTMAFVQDLRQLEGGDRGERRELRETLE